MNFVSLLNAIQLIADRMYVCPYGDDGLTIKQASGLMKCSERRISDLIRKGHICAVIISPESRNASFRILRSAYLAFMQADNTTKSVAPVKATVRVSRRGQTASKSSGRFGLKG